MRRLLLLAAALLVFPGCLVHHWSATPDGKVLAGYSGKSVVVADAGFKSLESWPAPGKPAIVEISPDGAWLVYNTEDANELWLVDRASKSQKKIAEAEGIFLYNAWSPDSSQLAFVQKEKKEGAASGALRVFNVKTSETFTAIEECAPAYAWTPSGKALFAIQPSLNQADKEVSYGRLVSWVQGEPLKALAHVAGIAFVEALDEDNAYFTSAIVSLPGPAAQDPFQDAACGLFRVSRSTGAVARVGEAKIGWMTLSPDRKRFLAFVLKKREEGKDPEFRLEMFDVKGNSIRVMKEASAYKDSSPLLPLWLGNDRALIPLGEAEFRTFEVQSADGSSAEVVTDKIRAWSR